MRQQIKLIGASLSVLFLTSCITDGTSNINQSILFKAQTRTSNLVDEYTQLEPGEKVGVYIVRGREVGESSMSPSERMFDNLLLTCEAEGVLKPHKETNYTPGVSFVDFYAYAPYDESPEILSNQILQFTIQQDQSIAGALNKSDLLWSKLLHVSTISAETPSLTFDHCLSKIHVNIKAGVGVALNGYSMKIAGTKLGVGLNLSNGMLTETFGDINEIIPLSLAGRSGFEVIVIPQTLAKGTPLFSITNNGKIYSYSVKKETIFEKGTKYTFDITINANDLNVEMKGSVKDWNTGDTVTEDIS